MPTLASIDKNKIGQMQSPKNLKQKSNEKYSSKISVGDPIPLNQNTTPKANKQGFFNRSSNKKTNMAIQDESIHTS